MVITWETILKNRINSLYRDACDAEKQEGFGLLNSAQVIGTELDSLIQYCVNHGLDEVLDVKVSKTASELGDRGYMQYVKTNIRKLADYLDVKFDDEQKHDAQTVLNLIQNQNVTQVTSQVFENMISNINQLDIDIDLKKEILKSVNDFKDESTKDDPDTNKLKKLFQSITSKSKEAAAMLSYWATITGAMKLLIGG